MQTCTRWRRIHSTRLLWVVLMLSSVSITPLLAQKTWTGASGSSWNTSGNWSPAGVPAATDEVVISSGSPVIESGVSALAKYVEVQAGASLSVSSGGSLSVVGSKVVYSDGTIDLSAAFQNFGTVTVGGQLIISNDASKSYGIVNDASFTISANGEVKIDNTGYIGFWNHTSVLTTASLTNNGKLTMGGTGSLGASAIFNEVSILNNAGGTLTIDRAGGANINNRSGSSFVNSGTIAIGQNATSNGPGIYNYSTFKNQSTGVLKIDRSSTAIFNLIDTSPVSFTNAGSIQIGQLETVYGPGIHNLSTGSTAITFINTASGEIKVDRTYTGVYNENRSTSPASFTNAGKLYIGQTNLSSSSPGIHNVLTSTGNLTFRNTTGAEIKVDRASTAIQNEAQGTGVTSFTNAGSIRIGQIASINSVGLLNTSYSGTPNVLFTNTSGAEVIIDNARTGLQNESPVTFANAGTVTIGTNSTATSSSPGLLNRGSLTNQSSGFIAVERISTSALHHSDNTLTNSGTITIGVSTSTGGDYSPSVLLSSTFVNGAGAILLIDNCIGGGLHTTSQLTNAGLIDIGKNGPAGRYGFYNGGTVSNQQSGTIIVDHVNGSNSWGLFSSYGNTFTNAGTISIGRSYSSGQTGLYNFSTFTNSGSISIDNVIPGTYSIHGLYNGSNTFTNTGLVTIGTSSTVGDWGLYNTATFNNNSGGEITINRAGITGLRNESSANFTNNGKIAIGTATATSQWGLFNTGQFTNNSDITVDNATISGLRHQANTFTNTGTIKIGSIAGSGSWGFWNESVFNNLNGGISVDRATNVNFENAKSVDGIGVFTNKASLSISTGTAATLGFMNEPGTTFSNSSCAALTLYDNLSNVGALTNQGLIYVNTAKPHSNTGMTNDGVISYAQANFIPNVTNNDLIIAPVNTTCGQGTNVIQIGGSNSFSIASTWYKDAGLTQAAGTYNAGSNTFTPSGLSTGPTQLYFAVTDNATNCVKTASIAIQITAASGANTSIQNLSTTAVLGSPNCSVALNGQVTGSAFTINGPNGYVYSKVYRKAGTYDLSGFLVKEPGVYTLSASAIGECGATIPVTQTITVTGTKCP